MKRLFEVNGEFFDLKDNAKKARGEPTAKGGLESVDPGKTAKLLPPKYKFQIHLGPDHVGYHGWRAGKTSHRAPQALQPQREGPRVRKNAVKK